VRYQKSHGIVILAFFDDRDALRAATAIAAAHNDAGDPELNCRFVRIGELVKVRHNTRLAFFFSDED
jgi:hypothetical protein